MFARLHNICVDELKKQNPNWKADRVFEEARLIVMSAIKQINYAEVKNDAGTEPLWTPDGPARTISTGELVRSTGLVVHDRLVESGVENL